VPETETPVFTENTMAKRQSTTRETMVQNTKQKTKVWDSHTNFTKNGG